ncbi:MAG TPA: YaiI/YqxD family protein [Candidatus Krumholzibacteria bacterium]|nr:YaiI/YqxD family protein [Candidatus Krumholzibacteria bacterium]
MQIWADADALPGAIRDILFRAAQRVGVKLTLVASKSLRTPDTNLIHSLWVPVGEDAADHKIMELMQAGDLVITADIPLAAKVVDKGGLALDPRGELYSRDNIGERLATRNLLDELRSGGQRIGGPAPIDSRARQTFANQLDRWLAQQEL